MENKNIITHKIEYEIQNNAQLGLAILIIHICACTRVAISWTFKSFHPPLFSLLPSTNLAIFKCCPTTHYLHCDTSSLTSEIHRASTHNLPSLYSFVVRNQSHTCISSFRNNQYASSFLTIYLCFPLFGNASRRQFFFLLERDSLSLIANFLFLGAYTVCLEANPISSLLH
jgi:hypothetical protein